MDLKLKVLHVLKFAKLARDEHTAGVSEIVHFQDKQCANLRIKKQQRITSEEPVATRSKHAKP